MGRSCSRSLKVESGGSDRRENITIPITISSLQVPDFSSLAAVSGSSQCLKPKESVEMLSGVINCGKASLASYIKL